MSDLRLRRLKDNFLSTMKEVSDILGISEHEITRDMYVRCAVDNKIEGRLNKESLNLLGGFKSLKQTHFPEVVVIKDMPKMLFYDVETAPLISAVWGMWDQNVGLNMIQSDWHLLSFSAKWADSDEIIYMDQRDQENIEDDKHLLEALWKLLDEADIVVGQNSKKFDNKKVNARFIMNGMQPPSSYRNIDTLTIAKRHFAFTSNKLAYMTDKLCTKYKKLTHAKFSGFDLWKECMAGNPEAWVEMEEYNKMDVLSLEELYEKLIPWDSSLNFSAYNENSTHTCSCGGTHFKDNGFYYTNAAKYQKYKCNRCGSEYRDSKNLLSKDKRKSMLKPTSRLR